jgi:hypothetical protein
MSTVGASTQAELVVAKGIRHSSLAYRSFLAALGESQSTDAGWSDGFLALVQHHASNAVQELADSQQAIDASFYAGNDFPQEIKRLVTRLHDCWTQLLVVQNECGLRYVRSKLITSHQLDSMLSERVESWLAQHGCSLTDSRSG